MEPSDLLRHLSEVFEKLGLSYFVTGSVASVAYGEPRFTNDIDVVVDLGVGDVDKLCAAFPSPEYYCSRDAVLQAVQQRFQFNILHPASGLKIDIMLPADSEFDRSRFQRKLRVPSGDNIAAWFASPEDVIVKKLDFYREGQSDKHLRDIVGILKIRGDQTDREYIERWTTRLGLDEIWAEVQNRLNVEPG